MAVSVFGASAPPGTQGLFTDGPVLVGNVFLIAEGTSASYNCVGARLYIASTTGLPATFTISLIPSGSDLTVAAARTATGTTATGWVEVTWSSPYAVTAGIPFTIAYQFGSGSTAYLANASPGAARIVSTADAAVAMSADIDTGWRRGMYQYGGGSVNGTALLWDVDVQMSTGSVANGSITAVVATATGLARSVGGNNPPKATGSALARPPAVTATGTSRTIYGTSEPVGTATSSDNNDLQLMHVFSDSAGGTISKVRYYVSDATMAGVIGGQVNYSIWRSGVPGATLGTLLIPAAVGWVEDTLATPVTMLPSTLYGVSISLHPTAVATKFGYSPTSLPKSSSTLSLTASGFNYSATPMWAGDVNSPSSATGTTSYLIDIAIDTPPVIVTGTVATATALARPPAVTGNVANGTVSAVVARATAASTPMTVDAETVLTGTNSATSTGQALPPRLNATQFGIGVPVATVAGVAIPPAVSATRPNATVTAVVARGTGQVVTPGLPIAGGPLTLQRYTGTGFVGISVRRWNGTGWDTA